MDLEAHVITKGNAHWQHIWIQRDSSHATLRNEINLSVLPTGLKSVNDVAPQLHAVHITWSGLVWSGLVWSGLVWSGLVWSGLVWQVVSGLLPATANIVAQYYVSHGRVIGG